MDYTRQEKYIKIGKEGQRKLKKSIITILGMGALGTTVAEILTRSGIGKIKLIDRDIVESSNITSQALYNLNDINKLKVEAAKEKLEKINNETKIETYPEDLDHDNVELLNSDLILDCTDNLYTRFVINDYAAKKKILWIYSSVIESKGMTLTIKPNGPCLRCIIQEPTQTLETCDTQGVLNAAIHAMASIQAKEAIKILLKQNYEKNLIVYDIWNNNLEKIKIKINKKCKTCNKQYEYLTGEKAKNITKLCGSGVYQLKNENINFQQLKEKLGKIGKVAHTNDILLFKNVIILKNGLIRIKTANEKEAKTTYNKYLGEI